MNLHYLDVAEQSTPTLYKTKKEPTGAVKLAADGAAFMGIGTVKISSSPDYYVNGSSFIVDFGCHNVGFISFFAGHWDKYLDAPVRLRLRFAEVPYELSRNFAETKAGLCHSWLQEEIINIDSEGVFSMPRRYAFRYAEISVIFTPRKLVLNNFSVTAVSSANTQNLVPLPASTDSMFVKIDAVAAKTLAECMQTAYEDGPKRDRRLWSGDLRIQALTDYYLYNNTVLARRCLYLFAACEKDGCYLPGCLYQSPKVYADGDVGITDYAMHWCSAVCDYYEHTGDRKTARELFSVVKRQINLAISLLDKNGVLTYLDGWNMFIDWAPSIERKTAVHGVFLYTLNKCIALATQLDDISTANLWNEQLTENRQKAYNAYFSQEKGYFCSCYDNYQYSVHSQVWMILGGVISGEAAVKILKKALSDENSLKPVTPFMHHYVLEAFVKLGLINEMKDYIISYWGGMVKLGADTFWETYEPDNPALSAYSDVLMNSFCHAWSCSPSYFIRKYLI